MRFLFGIFLLLNLLSCDQKNQDQREKQHSLKEVKPMFKGESTFETEIENIEKDSKLLEVTSLEYLSKDGEYFVVKGLVSQATANKEMVIKKLTFTHTAKEGNGTTLSFYYIGKRKFASICEKTVLEDNTFKKNISKSYYDDSSKVFFSKKGINQDIENYEIDYVVCKPVEHDDDLALKIINQEDEFETLFQGFMESMGRIYLILGTNNFTSTVAFSEYNPTLTL